MVDTVVLANGGGGGVDVLRLVVKLVPFGSEVTPDPEPNCVGELVCDARVFTKDTVETDTLGVTGPEEALTVGFKTSDIDCMELDNGDKPVAGDSIGVLEDIVITEIETLGVMVKVETLGYMIIVETEILGGILGTKVGWPISALEEGKLDEEEVADTPGDCVFVGGLELVGSSNTGTVD